MNFYKKTSSGKELVFSIYFYSIWINFLQPGVIKMFIHPFLPLMFRRNLLGSLITADERSPDTDILTTKNKTRIQVSTFPAANGIFSIQPENTGYNPFIQTTAAIPQKKQYNRLILPPRLNIILL